MTLYIGTKHAPRLPRNLMCFNLWKAIRTCFFNCPLIHIQHDSTSIVIPHNYNYRLNEEAGYKRAAPRAEVMFKMHMANMAAWQILASSSLPAIYTWQTQRISVSDIARTLTNYETPFQRHMEQKKWLPWLNRERSTHKLDFATWWSWTLPVRMPENRSC